MPTIIDCDVLIAGAGPTGMAAAITLHDAGYRVMIIDKHITGLTFSRAILVNSQTLSMLEPYGIADKIMSMGRPFTSLTINGPNGVILTGNVNNDHTVGVHPTALPQLSTEQCFVEGLLERGITINRPCTFIKFDQNESYVDSIVLRDGQYVTVRSQYLLGADGFHSSVRKVLGFNYNQSSNPILMYSQDAIIDWSGCSDINIWFLDSGSAFAMKIDDNQVRFAATSKETFLSLGFNNQIKRTTWESEFDVFFAQVDTYGDRRVWLAGDAAHVHSPIGGRGMNMGIADGILFADAVINNDFISYQRDRHAISGDWVRKNKLLTEIMSDKYIKGQIGRVIVRSAFRLISLLTSKNAAKMIFEAIAVG